MTNWTDADLAHTLRVTQTRLAPLQQGPPVVPGDNAWSFLLPLPPSLNHTYVPIAGRLATSPTSTKYVRKKVLTPAALQFKKDVGSLVMTQRRGRPPLTGRLRLWVELHAPDHRRRDLDDFCFKLVQDALTEARVWEDDSQLDDIRGLRGGVSTPGYLAVLIGRVQPWELG